MYCGCLLNSVQKLQFCYKIGQKVETLSKDVGLTWIYVLLESVRAAKNFRRNCSENPNTHVNSYIFETHAVQAYYRK